MCDGFDLIINRALGVDDFETKTAALNLSARPVPVDGAELINSLYNQVEVNWGGCHCRSEENWRWRLSPKMWPHNKSPEKTLEKEIVRHSSGEWVNQIPTSSGWLHDVEERHANVDLGRKCGTDWYELVELKAGLRADTPLKAAFEILRYGLMYCFARLHRQELGSYQTVLLTAKQIDLKVLAPCSAYDRYSFAWLATALDCGLGEFCRKRFDDKLKIHFGYEAFPREFNWPPSSEPQELLDFLQRRSAYCWPIHGQHK